MEAAVINTNPLGFVGVFVENSNNKNPHGSGFLLLPVR
jgi:hypothetical protein